MNKQERCRNCGRPFEPRSAGDRFCSELCRRTGLFVGGGGDTTKPGTAAAEKSPAAKKNVADEETVAKVKMMFELPISERWAVAKNFTAAERTIAAKMMRKMLAEEERMLAFTEWNGADGEEETSAEGETTKVGESDDGTV